MKGLFTTPRGAQVFVNVVFQDYYFEADAEKPYGDSGIIQSGGKVIRIKATFSKVRVR